MKRRTFVKAAVASGVVIGTGGYAWLRSGADHSALTIDASLRQIDALARQNVSSIGEWDAFRIFAHCAQSVEFSMAGFPQHKPALFKNTLGKLAFGAFTTKGKMSHSLSEPIPGAPALHANPDYQAALARLRTALITFRDFTGELQPHFAYGQLTKDEYTIAHVIHLNNHMLEIRS